MGVVVFNNLAEALARGYQVWERTNAGYTVRIRTERGWALAFVDLRTPAAA